MFSACYQVHGWYLATLRFFESFGMETAEIRYWKKGTPPERVGRKASGPG